MISHSSVLSKQLLVSFISIILFNICISQTTNLGSGSYTSTFPGLDSEGRNSFLSGAPQLSGNALGKPVPTNEWWSSFLKENHANNLFNYPMAMNKINFGFDAIQTDILSFGVCCIGIFYVNSPITKKLIVY